MRILKQLLLLGGAFFIAGCDEDATEADYEKLGLVSVSGTVTLDGEPLFGADIQFEGPDQSFSYGTTDFDGFYSLRFNSERSGVLPGAKTIRIRSAAPVGESDDRAAGTPENESADASEGSAPPALRAIPACYNTKSTLVLEVTSSSSTIDFDLKSDCSTTGAK